MGKKTTKDSLYIKEFNKELERLKKEVASAREYDINWIKKRKNILAKNYLEMMEEYHPFKTYALKLGFAKSLNWTLNHYINEKTKAILNAPAYTTGVDFMAHNPNDEYTKEAKRYMKKYPSMNPESAFRFVQFNNGFSGFTWFDESHNPYIYVARNDTGTPSHEFWHVGTYQVSDDPYNPGTYEIDPSHYAAAKYLRQDPYIKNLLVTKRLNWDKPVTETSVDNPNYMWNLDEVLARRATLMHYLNWNPNKKATLKDVQNWRKQGLLNPDNAGTFTKNNPLFPTIPYIGLDKLSDQTILHLINDVAFNNTISKPELVLDVYYAYKGGLIKKPKK